MDGTETALATYRLQFNEQFRFDDARELVPYLSRLGITHLYSSPILRARSGSTHGYDVVDPKTIHPSLGDENDFRAMVTALRSFGMGLVLDIVPNHMAASSTENPYWHEVLMYGESAPHAGWFDIDWRTPDRELWGRVIIPILGNPLARVLKDEQLQLTWEEGRLCVRYFDHVFPLDPATLPVVLEFGRDELATCLGEEHPALAELNALITKFRSLPGRGGKRQGNQSGVIEEINAWQSQLAQLLASSPQVQDWAEKLAKSFGEGPEGHLRLRKLLDAQNYRLAFWRRAARAINYRRFFDINDLVSIRQEDPQVFDETHETVLRWVREGLVQGLRIDHLDGLRDPLGYLVRLRQAMDREHELTHRPMVFVEKILAPDEPLREDWPVDGTTGYEFLNEVEASLLSASGFAEIKDDYRRLLRKRVRFHSFAIRGKRRVLCNELSSHVGRLADMLLQLTRETPARSDVLSKKHLAEAIVEVAAALPVYRTYIDERGELDPEDERALHAAFEKARTSLKALPEPIDFLEEVLLLKRKEELSADWFQRRLHFVRRFQQITGPAAAKGIEDTALYAYVPLVSRNEVGGEPDAPLERAVDQLHQENQRRARCFPRSMLAATTHDTKRTADVRARLDVLSEFPRLWKGFIHRWQRLNRPHRSRVSGKWAPDTATEYLFYQSLVGIWPAPDPDAEELTLPSQEIREDLCQRLVEYMMKAAREAKQRTNWVNPNPPFEEALEAFVRRSFCEDAEKSCAFLNDVNTCVAQIARIGFWNSLSRTVLQFTSPGTPDLYQGDELWNFALVDPDNRREVDFASRRDLLDQLIVAFEQERPNRPFLQSLVEQPEDGRIKLHVVHHLLRARREYPALFALGDYEPLSVTGPLAEHVIAFARHSQGQVAVIAVPRLTGGLVSHTSQAPIGDPVWSEETSIALPSIPGDQRWRSLLTGETICTKRCQQPGESMLNASVIFGDLPVAVLATQRAE